MHLAAQPRQRVPLHVPPRQKPQQLKERPFVPRVKKAVWRKRTVELVRQVSNQPLRQKPHQLTVRRLKLGHCRPRQPQNPLFQRVYVRKVKKYYAGVNGGTPVKPVHKVLQGTNTRQAHKSLPDTANKKPKPKLYGGRVRRKRKKVDVRPPKRVCVTLRLPVLQLLPVNVVRPLVPPHNRRQKHAFVQIVRQPVYTVAARVRALPLLPPWQKEPA